MSQNMPVPQVARRRRRRHTSVLEIGPGTDVGSYVVEARQGAGGFGTVFRARRGGLLYALKFLSLAEHAGWAEREAVVLTRVRHRNVARLCGYSEWPDGQPRFLVVVMEYVAGQRLDEWAQEHNPSARQVLRLLKDLSQGLGAVHRAGVVHRDVKEANILVRQEDGEAVLVDFGVSGHEQAARVTPGRMPPGTPEYRSPEAWRFVREYTRESSARYQPAPADDLYALGVVLYWLLTDDLLFCAGGEVDAEAVLHQRPVPPEERNARVPPELSELCLRLLAKAPGARPDAAALGQAVEELLTRQDAAWDEPLCEPYEEHNRTTQGGDNVDEEEQWAKAPPRPRRGKRPEPPVAPQPVDVAVPEVEAAAQAPQPAAPIPPPASPANPRRRRATWAAGAGLLLVLSVLVFALGTRGHAPVQSDARLGPVPPTSQGGWKVAPPLEPPESERAAPLEREGAPAAPVAAGATAPQHEAPVKTPQQKQTKRLGPVKKAAALAGACASLSCSGPSTEVRSPPVTAEPCPQGSLEAMEKLGIRIGKEADGEFSWFHGNVTMVKVNEGWTTLRTFEDLGELEASTVLSGRIILTEKWAYGHWVQATTEQGKTYPVCLESREERNDEGEVESSVFVKAVREFK